MTLWRRNSTKSLPSLYVKLWWIITILIIIEKTSSSAIVISRCSVNDELALKKMMAFSFERSNMTKLLPLSLADEIFVKQ
jgi:hypothetical protein